MLNRLEFKGKYCEICTNGNVQEWAELWRERQDEIKNQMTAILITKMEKGFNGKGEFKEGYEEGYRTGLAELARLWSLCYSEFSYRQKQINREIKKEKKIVL